MITALREVRVPKPSGTELRKYAGRAVGVPKGSKSTVRRAHEYGLKKRWCYKPPGKQWQWNESHYRSVTDERRKRS